jgi:AcrR family transcriptional regulator
MSLTMGRREQKKINNRKAILDAGLEVFSTIGYERATINDVVSASGLSVGTFYNHCGDKDTVFSELLTLFLTEVRSTLSMARQKAVSVESFIMGAFVAYSEFISQYPKMQQLISKNSSVFKQVIADDPELTGIIEDLKRDMQLAVDAGIVPEFSVSMMTSAMIASSIEIFSDNHDEYSAQERAEFLGNLFLGGIDRLSSK